VIDKQLMVELDELDDELGELAADQPLVGAGAGVRVVCCLVGKVLDEELGQSPTQ